MLNEGDSWPVTCINCGQTTLIEIRHLKTRAEFTCRRCGRTFEFLTQAFINALEQARVAVRAVRDATVLLVKKT